MIAWMMYTALVGMLLAGAAGAIDKLARLAGRPTRWIWVGAMLASIALAAVAPYRRIASPAIPVSTAGGGSPSDTVSAASSWVGSLELGFTNARRGLDAPLITGAAALVPRGARRRRRLQRGLRAKAHGKRI